jgi:beta-glucanase (GH16 family)
MIIKNHSPLSVSFILFAKVFCLFICTSCAKKEELAPVTPPPVVIPVVVPKVETILEPSDYTKIIWQDEFDGTSIDLNKWEMEIGDKWFNNELQAYTNSPANAFIQTGNLVIQANKETLRSANYTSARMRTKLKGDWTYGKIDVRAKLPKGQGIWPAIWMLPTDEVFGGWPKSGEIDIMEFLGHDLKTTYGTVHYGQEWPKNQHQGTGYKLPSGTFSDGFHIFSIIWTKDFIRWYVDGEQFFSITKGALSPENYPFNNRFHLILNLAVGGDWPGNPDANTVFPQQMLVDYVRVSHPE